MAVAACKIQEKLRGSASCSRTPRHAAESELATSRPAQPPQLQPPHKTYSYVNVFNHITIKFEGFFFPLTGNFYMIWKYPRWLLRHDQIRAPRPNWRQRRHFSSLWMLIVSLYINQWHQTASCEGPNVFKSAAALQAKTNKKHHEGGDWQRLKKHQHGLSCRLEREWGKFSAELAFTLPKANMYNWILFEQVNEAALCLTELFFFFF